MYLYFYCNVLFACSITPAETAMLVCIGCLAGLAWIYFIQLRYAKADFILFDAIDMCEKYNNRRIKEVLEKKLAIEDCDDAFDWFLDKLPSIEKMVYSTKPMVLESFINKKLIEKLNS